MSSGYVRQFSCFGSCITIVVAILNYFLFTNLYFLVTIVCACIVLPLLISIYSYTRIFLTIRRQQKQLQNILGSSGINMSRYKKTVFNSLWMHFTLTACYVPFALVSGLMAVRGLSSSLFLAQFWAFTLVYLNSSLNPVLYFVEGHRFINFIAIKCYPL